MSFLIFLFFLLNYVAISFCLPRAYSKTDHRLPIITIKIKKRTLVFVIKLYNVHCLGFCNKIAQCQLSWPS